MGKEKEHGKSKNKFKVFLCWSGKLSFAVAKNFYGLLLEIFDKDVVSEEVFFSDNIQAGDVWSNAIKNSLNKSPCGIVFLTEHNFNNPWIMFESGSLLMGRAQTLILKLNKFTLTEPLGLYQSLEFSETSIYNVLQKMQDVLTCTDKLSDDELTKKAQKFALDNNAYIKDNLQDDLNYLQDGLIKKSIIEAMLNDLKTFVENKVELISKEKVIVETKIQLCNYADNQRILKYPVLPNQSVSYPLSFGDVGNLVTNKITDKTYPNTMSLYFDVASFDAKAEEDRKTLMQARSRNGAENLSDAMKDMAKKNNVLYTSVVRREFRYLFASVIMYRDVVIGVLELHIYNRDEVKDFDETLKNSINNLSFARKVESYAEIFGNLLVKLKA